MNKKEFIEKYKELDKISFDFIDDLYMYSCLITSGFEEDIAYDLIVVLRNLWLKDESGSSISSLSDCLYEHYEEIDFENMSIREILVEIL